MRLKERMEIFSMADLWNELIKAFVRVNEITDKLSELFADLVEGEEIVDNDKRLKMWEKLADEIEEIKKRVGENYAGLSLYVLYDFLAWGIGSSVNVLMLLLIGFLLQIFYFKEIPNLWYILGMLAVATWLWRSIELLGRRLFSFMLTFMPGTFQFLYFLFFTSELRLGFLAWILFGISGSVFVAYGLLQNIPVDQILLGIFILFIFFAFIVQTIANSLPRIFGIFFALSMLSKIATGMANAMGMAHPWDSASIFSLIYLAVVIFDFIVHLFVGLSLYTSFWLTEALQKYVKVLTPFEEDELLKLRGEDLKNLFNKLREQARKGAIAISRTEKEAILRIKEIEKLPVISQGFLKKIAKRVKKPIFEIRHQYIKLQGRLKDGSSISIYIDPKTKKVYAAKKGSLLGTFSSLREALHKLGAKMSDLNIINKRMTEKEWLADITNTIGSITLSKDAGFAKIGENLIAKRIKGNEWGVFAVVGNTEKELFRVVGKNVDSATKVLKSIDENVKGSIDDIGKILKKVKKGEKVALGNLSIVKESGKIIAKINDQQITLGNNIENVADFLKSINVVDPEKIYVKPIYGAPEQIDLVERVGRIAGKLVVDGEEVEVEKEDVGRSLAGKVREGSEISLLPVRVIQPKDREFDEWITNKIRKDITDNEAEKIRLESILATYGFENVDQIMEGIRSGEIRVKKGELDGNPTWILEKNNGNKIIISKMRRGNALFVKDENGARIRIMGREGEIPIEDVIEGENIDPASRDALMGFINDLGAAKLLDISELKGDLEDAIKEGDLAKISGSIEEIEKLGSLGKKMIEETIKGKTEFVEKLSELLGIPEGSLLTGNREDLIKAIKVVGKLEEVKNIQDPFEKERKIKEIERDLKNITDKSIKPLLQENTRNTIELERWRIRTAIKDMLKEKLENRDTEGAKEVLHKTTEMFGSKVSKDVLRDIKERIETEKKMELSPEMQKLFRGRPEIELPPMEKELKERIERGDVEGAKELLHKITEMLGKEVSKDILRETRTLIDAEREHEKIRDLMLKGEWDKVVEELENLEKNPEVYRKVTEMLGVENKSPIEIWASYITEMIKKKEKRTEEISKLWKDLEEQVEAGNIEKARSTFHKLRMKVGDEVARTILRKAMEEAKRERLMKAQGVAKALVERIGKVAADKSLSKEEKRKELQKLQDALRNLVKNLPEIAEEPVPARKPLTLEKSKESSELTPLEKEPKVKSKETTAPHEIKREVAGGSKEISPKEMEKRPISEEERAKELIKKGIETGDRESILQGTDMLEKLGYNERKITDIILDIRSEIRKEKEIKENLPLLEKELKEKMKKGESIDETFMKLREADRLPPASDSTKEVHVDRRVIYGLTKEQLNKIKEEIKESKLPENIKEEIISKIEGDYEKHGMVTTKTATEVIDKILEPIKNKEEVEKVKKIIRTGYAARQAESYQNAREGFIPEETGRTSYDKEVLKEKEVKGVEGRETIAISERTGKIKTSQAVFTGGGRTFQTIPAFNVILKGALTAPKEESEKSMKDLELTIKNASDDQIKLGYEAFIRTTRAFQVDPKRAEKIKKIFLEEMKRRGIQTHPMLLFPSGLVKMLTPKEYENWIKNVIDWKQQMIRIGKDPNTVNKMFTKRMQDIYEEIKTQYGEETAKRIFSKFRGMI